MLQLQSVPARECPSRVRAEAIAVLDQQLALEGAFLLPDGTVLVLSAAPDGSWRISYWEPMGA